MLQIGRGRASNCIGGLRKGAERCASTLGADSSSRQQVIFSGIQPTGVPHLGNFLGALQRWVKLQDEAHPETTLLYSLVDLHAITAAQHPEQLRQWRKESLATLLAVGLDPSRSILFHQSSVPAHSELMWILSCNASVGYLSRMTQWKTKLSLPENASPLDPTTKSPLKLGLFSYPVLQAADILVHRATHVPVGEDQAQHLEFARECATSFNHHMAAGKDILVPPQTIVSPAKRIMSLTRPESKMSKSDSNPKSRILITDSREAIFSKVKGAVTDSIEGISYEPTTRPGVSNLLSILYHLNNGNFSSLQDVGSECKDLSMRALKERVAEMVDATLSGIRDRYAEVMQRRGGAYLDEVAQSGAERARKSAERTMRDVREAIGL